MLMLPARRLGAEAFGGEAARLLRRLRARGGQVVCGRRVTGVLVKRGRAVGVRDQGGEVVLAKQAVLADVPAPALYLDLVGADKLPPRLVDDLDAFEWDSATVKVGWALSGPVPWTAQDARGAGTLHLGGDLNGLSRFAADLNVGEIPQNPFLLVGQMTTADPSRSSEGTASVWAYTAPPTSRVTT